MNRPLDPLFRQAQQDAIQYRSGTLAISAVPGSGKTFTLAHLAARLVSRLSKSDLMKEREILVVTFTNSAVNSLRRKIAGVLQRDRGLLPYVGYRVRTLHGLAHDIVRERPTLLGLTEDFRILDEPTSHQIIRELTESNLRQYGDSLKSFIYADLLQDKQQTKKILSYDLPELTIQICERFIKYCKDNMMTPGDFYANENLERFPLAQFGLRVYDDYQRSLAYRGALDFDDLVRLALVAINENEDFRTRLQKRWPYILEDEAQDSSALQEQMLRRLTETHGNWVRVGDPNQAINTTFTTANPRYLREFAQQAENQIPLTQSGRSGRPIADLANVLVEWAVAEHPIHEVREAFDYRLIESTLPGDPQPNPLTEETQVYIHPTNQPVTPDRELTLTLESLQRWLPENGDKTVAVLVPENHRGFKLMELLQRAYLPCEELLRSTSTTREVAAAFQATLKYLAAPLDAQALAAVYCDVWWGWNLGQIKLVDLKGEVELDSLIEQATKSIANYQQLEDFLWPADESAWISRIKIIADYPVLEADLIAFREHVRHWLQAMILPIDQLMLTIGQDIFRDPADLALSHKMAVALRATQDLNPEWRVNEFVAELQAISSNERRFIGIEDMASGYEPRTGVITVSTLHAAKGLEWDRVYLLGVNNYSFPSAEPGDIFISEKWFVRDHLNLEAETLAQVDALRDDTVYREGIATGQARLDYASERLRLLYVGITRARRELVILWNTGRYSYRGGSMVCQPALPLTILFEYVGGTRIVKRPS